MSIGHVCHQSLAGLSCTSIRPKAISRLEASQEKGRLVRRVGHLGRCFVNCIYIKPLYVCSLPVLDLARFCAWSLLWTLPVASQNAAERVDPSSLPGEVAVLAHLRRLFQRTRRYHDIQGGLLGVCVVGLGEVQQKEVPMIRCYMYLVIVILYLILSYIQKRSPNMYSTVCWEMSFNILSMSLCSLWRLSLSFCHRLSHYYTPSKPWLLRMSKRCLATSSRPFHFRLRRR